MRAQAGFAELISVNEVLKLDNWIRAGVVRQLSACLKILARCVVSTLWEVMIANLFTVRSQFSAFSPFPMWSGCTGGNHQIRSELTCCEFSPLSKHVSQESLACLRYLISFHNYNIDIHQSQSSWIIGAHPDVIWGCVQRINLQCQGLTSRHLLCFLPPPQLIEQTLTIMAAIYRNNRRRPNIGLIVGVIIGVFTSRMLVLVIVIDSIWAV